MSDFRVKRKRARNVAALLVVVLSGTVGVAHASHGADTCKNSDKQQIGAYNSSTAALDNVSSWVRVINPSPNPTNGILRSIYVYGSILDSTGLPLNHVEIGWKWIVDPLLVAPNTDIDSSPTVFMFRILDGTPSASEGLASSNPGWGGLFQASDAHFKLQRNATGSDPYTYTGYVDRSSGAGYEKVGAYYNPNLYPSNAYALTGAEGWGYCEDMVAHFWFLNYVSGGAAHAWANVTKTAPAGQTKWFYFDKDMASPEWWSRHCGTSANCPDAA